MRLLSRASLPLARWRAAPAARWRLARRRRQAADHAADADARSGRRRRRSPARVSAGQAVTIDDAGHPQGAAHGPRAGPGQRRPTSNMSTDLQWVDTPDRLFQDLRRRDRAADHQPRRARPAARPPRSRACWSAGSSSASAMTRRPARSIVALRRVAVDRRRHAGRDPPLRRDGARRRHRGNGRPGAQPRRQPGRARRRATGSAAEPPRPGSSTTCSNTSFDRPGVATIRSSACAHQRRRASARTAASGRTAGPAAPRPAG